MADKGIIFSAPMVRALLDGRKTQTRRLLKPQPPAWVYPNRKPGYSCLTPKGHIEFRGLYTDETGVDHGPCSKFIKLPHLKGDRLYVREACCAVEDDDGFGIVEYRADNITHGIENSPEADKRWFALNHYRGVRGAWVPSIHMPRWASRLTLLVTDVRVQRLQEISEADAIAEGIQIGEPLIGERPNAASLFKHLWNSLHTKPGERWEDNPWIVALTFDVVHENIDRIANHAGKAVPVMRWIGERIQAVEHLHERKTA